MEERSHAMVLRFMIAAAPRANRSERAFAGELLVATMAALGREVSELSPTPSQVDRWADATADMLLGYFDRLGRKVS